VNRLCIFKLNANGNFLKIVILNSKNEKFKISNFWISVLCCKTFSIYCCLKSSRQAFSQVLHHAHRERFPLFFQSSSSFAGFLFLHCWSRMDHKFSMGLKSGDWAGQFKRHIPFFCINSLFNLAVFFGSLSSWKIQFSLNYRRRSFLAQGSNFVFNFFLYCSLSRIPSTLILLLAITVTFAKFALPQRWSNNFQ